eukprot:TRINITY_DN24546_c0_g1_i1.p1 TRINITY_DN24546_c0_g1~~TRINITY_DN24546_c0_g1_i1.p1  ORF type:complete len:877 (+),score=215.13 TRINITY_DN24546_c0_g1_i1:37-2631(+)
MLPTHELLSQWAAESPDEVAVHSPAEVLTYGAADAAADGTAEALAEEAAGVPDGVVPLCAVCCAQGACLPITLAAVERAGWAWVLIDAAHTPPRRAAALCSELQSGDGGPVAFAHTPLRLTAAVAEPGVWLELMRSALPSDVPVLPPPTPSRPASRPALPLPRAADLPAYVCFTSGSTGRPKGVVVQRRGLTNLLEHAAGILTSAGCGAHPRVSWLTSPSFDIALLELLLPLRMGGACVPVASREPSEVAQVLAAMRVDVAQCTPAAWAPLCGLHAVRSLPRYRICGGEAMPPPLCSQLFSGAAAAWDAYGPTEATVWAAFHRLAASDGSGGVRPPLGLPVAHHQLLAQPFQDGDGEELVISGPGVALGYLAGDARGAFSSTDSVRSFRTGDAVVRRSGQLVIAGRRDAQVKVRGHRVELGDVESALAGCPAVSMAAAVVADLHPDGAYSSVSRAIVGFVVPARGAEGCSAAAKAAVAESLPKYMVPVAVREVPALPLLPSGKVDRKALGAQALPDLRAARTDAPTDFDSAVLQAVRDVLGLGDMEAGDSLSGSGLDSVGAVVLALRIGDVLSAACGAAWHAVDDGVPLILAAATTANLCDRLRRACPSLPKPAAPAAPQRNRQPRQKPLQADAGQGPALLAACRDGLTADAAAMIQSGAPIETCDRFGSSCLHYAAGAGALDLCRLLVRAGAAVAHADKKSGRNAVHWAARKGALDVVRFLVCDVGLPAEAVTKDNTTPLQLAAWGGHVEVAEWFAQRGSDVGHINRWGCTAAHFAALAGQLPFLQWLLRQGLDLGFGNQQNHSALHKAAYGGHGAVCDWLIEIGLPFTADARGQTPADLALKAGYGDLAEHLRVQETAGREP